jgi:hypothetical protein
MEHYLKILKVEYLSNHVLDHTRMLNLSLNEQTIFYKSLKWRQTPMEDNLIIASKVACMSCIHTNTLTRLIYYYVITN